MNRFKNRKLLIVTKHGKEVVLKSILEEGLGLECSVSHNIDTDLFGTFSGEKERALSVTETLKAKCSAGEKTPGFDFVLASEGSFGSHPFLPFASADEEMVMLLDVKRKIEYKSRVLTSETNMASKTISSKNELKIFADSVGFPAHGILLKDQETNFEIVEKNATNWEMLALAFDKIMKEKSSVFAETDLRAMRNPTRLRVIAEAGNKLVELLKFACPTCETPGFEVVKSEAGLPCERCSFPTKSTRRKVYKCRECQHVKTIEFPNGKKTEDAQFCDLCNP